MNQDGANCKQNWFIFNELSKSNLFEGVVRSNVWSLNDGWLAKWQWSASRSYRSSDNRVVWGPLWSSLESSGFGWIIILRLWIRSSLFYVATKSWVVKKKFQVVFSVLVKSRMLIEGLVMARHQPCGIGKSYQHYNQELWKNLSWKGVHKVEDVLPNVSSWRHTFVLW